MPELAPRRVPYRASAQHIHQAYVRDGIWGAACDGKAEWSVPLATDINQVTCGGCKRLHEVRAQIGGGDRG